jgi:hypothetical protein
MFELAVGSQVLSVGHEPHSRGRAYLALDRRRMFLFVSCSLRNITDAVEAFCNEQIGRSASYDIASCTSSRGYAGSFRIERCSRTELPEKIQLYRGKFQRVIICPSLNSAWTLSDAPAVKPETAESDDDVVEIDS